MMELLEKYSLEIAALLSLYLIVVMITRNFNTDESSSGSYKPNIPPEVLDAKPPIPASWSRGLRQINVIDIDTSEKDLNITVGINGNITIKTPGLYTIGGVNGETKTIRILKE